MVSECSWNPVGVQWSEVGIQLDGVGIQSAESRIKSQFSQIELDRVGILSNRVGIQFDRFGWSGNPDRSNCSLVSSSQNPVGLVDSASVTFLNFPLGWIFSGNTSFCIGVLGPEYIQDQSNRNKSKLFYFQRMRVRESKKYKNRV